MAIHGPGARTALGLVHFNFKLVMLRMGKVAIVPDHFMREVEATLECGSRGLVRRLHPFMCACAV